VDGPAKPDHVNDERDSWGLTQMVRGLSHITFIVRDLDRMETLLTTVLHARKVYDSGDQTFSLSREKFFLVGASPGDPDAPAPIWIAAMQGDPLPSRTYNHVAFKIDEADFDTYLERIRSLDLDVRECRSRVAGEGRSIYFHDDDNHLFELHTGTLGERLARYAHGR
jgi:catechol 2,3-dioxygenase-like lactoylglutathione lyase family enzyme